MMYNLCKVNVHSKENWALAIVGRRNLNSQAGNAKKKRNKNEMCESLVWLKVLRIKD